MWLKTLIFCSKVPSRCRKCHLRDSNFKYFPRRHVPWPLWRCVVNLRIFAPPPTPPNTYTYSVLIYVFFIGCYSQQLPSTKDFIPSKLVIGNHLCMTICFLDICLFNSLGRNMSAKISIEGTIDAPIWTSKRVEICFLKEQVFSILGNLCKLTGLGFH